MDTAPGSHAAVNVPTSEASSAATGAQPSQATPPSSPAATEDQPKPLPAPTPAGPSTGTSANPSERPDEKERLDKEFRQHRTDVNDYMAQNGPQETSRLFSVDDGVLISEEKEGEVMQLFVADSGECQVMLRILNAKRMLVLSGAPETGKTTAAIFLGMQLAEADEFVITEETCLVQPLGRHIRLNLHQLCTDAELFGKRLVIFEDALAYGNQDMRSVFARLEHGIAHLSTSLQRINAFLIFTACPADLNACQHILVANGVYHHLGQISPTGLEEGLTKRLQWLADQHLPTKRIEALHAARQQVCEAFRTMPRLARFVDYYVREELSGNNEATPAEAIQHFRDVPSWFLKDLAKDFDAWCFALSLCLAQCVREMRAIPWMEFALLWRALTECLRAHLVPRAEKTEGGAVGGDDTSALFIDDHAFLTRCRAEIVQDPSSLADTVRFRDPSYPAELWRTLLQHHRRLLTVLIPHLRRMAEAAETPEDLYPATLAAQILGRVGEMDPTRITFEAMRRWTTVADKRLRAHVGHLYRGVLSSAEERYRTLCLDELAMLTEPLDKEDEEEEKNRLLTAIATYTQIGSLDPPLAMRALQHIASRRLEPILHETQDLERLIKGVENAAARPHNISDALHLIATHVLLRNLAYQLYANEGSIFVGIQLALVSLCRTVDTVRVCQELYTWATASRTMGILVALLFLQESGIASQLEGRSIHAGLPDGTAATTDKRSTPPPQTPGHTSRRRNPLVLSLATGPEAVEQMARFLATIYQCFSTSFLLLPASQRYFRDSFGQHLRAWALEALPIENCRLAMEDLFVALLHIENDSLYEPIYQLLHHRDFLGARGELHIFVDAVLRKY